MLAEINLGFESLKAAMGPIQAMKTASTEVQINAVKIELQKALFDAQSALFAA